MKKSMKVFRKNMNTVKLHQHHIFANPKPEKSFCFGLLRRLNAKVSPNSLLILEG